MKNTNDMTTLSDINSEECGESGYTDQKLKIELDQMISKRQNCKTNIFKRCDSNTQNNFNISPCSFNKTQSKNINSSNFSSSSLDKNSQNQSSCDIENIECKINKNLQLMSDTRSDVLRILLILQKTIDDTKEQKHKLAKLESKIKELENKISCHSCHHSHSDSDYDLSNLHEYELKFDKFKQEVNTEILKLNSTIIIINTNLEGQIASLKEQIATLFSMPKHKHTPGKCH